MKKSAISFFAMNLILLFAVVGFIFAVFDLHRFAFVLELIVLLILASFLIFAMYAVYNNKKWGWTIIGAALIFLLFDSLIILVYTKTFEAAHKTVIFFSLAGVVVSFLNLKGVSQAREIQPEQNDRDYYQHIEKIEPKEQSKNSKPTSSTAKSLKV